MIYPSAILQDKIEKATAAIEAAKKSGEEFNKENFEVSLIFLFSLSNKRPFTRLSFCTQCT